MKKTEIKFEKQIIDDSTSRDLFTTTLSMAKPQKLNHGKKIISIFFPLIISKKNSNVNSALALTEGKNAKVFTFLDAIVNFIAFKDEK